jgi:hypothetical protein
VKNFFFVALFLFMANAHANFIASNNEEIKNSVPTHILIAGIPDQVEELFIESLLTQAQVLKEKFPNDQIIILGRSDDRKSVIEKGYNLIDKNHEQLKDKAIEELIKKLKLIKSIDIYAHSNPISGVLLDKGTIINQGLNESNDLWDIFENKLQKDAYINFHGCNAGLKMAPAVAKKLNVAVFAALTGTDFQTIYKDSFWSHDRNAEKSDRSEKNTLSFLKEKSCAGGYCRRMKPDNSSYKGYWGDWMEGGYPTYKIFCGSNDNKNCAGGVLEAMMSFPSILPSAKINTIEDFKIIVHDFMCPFAFNKEKQASCTEALEGSLIGKNTTYSPFNGVTLNCDLSKCFAHFSCKNSSSGSCHLVNEKPGVNETFTNEYKFILKAFEENYSAEKFHRTE